MVGLLFLDDVQEDLQAVKEFRVVLHDLMGLQDGGKHTVSAVVVLDKGLGTALGEHSFGQEPVNQLLQSGKGQLMVEEQVRRKLVQVTNQLCVLLMHGVRLQDLPHLGLPALIERSLQDSHFLRVRELSERIFKRVLEEISLESRHVLRRAEKWELDIFLACERTKRLDEDLLPVVLLELEEGLEVVIVALASKGVQHHLSLVGEVFIDEELRHVLGVSEYSGQEDA